MAKYHISKNGTVGVCTAEDGRCPLGGIHFKNPELAQEYADKTNELRAIVEKEFQNDNKTASETLDNQQQETSSQDNYSKMSLPERVEELSNRKNEITSLNLNIQQEAKEHNKLMRRPLKTNKTKNLIEIKKINIKDLEKKRKAKIDDFASTIQSDKEISEIQLKMKGEIENLNDIDATYGRGYWNPKRNIRQIEAEYGMPYLLG